MDLVVIIGSAAVGKMTTGQELAKITGLKLFHNHMTIEPVLEVLGYCDWDVIIQTRMAIFNAFAASDNKGLIYTSMIDFDSKADMRYLEKIVSIFRPYDTNIYFVELVAPQEVRLERNRSENRLLHKPSKRNIDESDARLIRDDEKARLESNGNEIPWGDYIKIDNTNLSAQEVAVIIKKRFSL